MVAKWRSLGLSEKFLLIGGVFMVARFSYATITWLLSSHPIGALVPGVFLFFFASFIYVRLKSDTTYEAVVRLTGSYLITGAATAVSIAVLWILAVGRDDAVYRDQAVTMSFWGGTFVIFSVVFLVKFATPRGRRNIRDQREAVTGGKANSTSE